MTTKKRAMTSFHSAIMDVRRRELGQLSSRNFANRLAASEDLVLRFDVLCKLDKHHGCVNTVCFNASGDILVSGSDDRKIILWDWESGQVKLSFQSGHSNNVFQAKMMPYSEDRSIVTCAADGQVRHAQILERGVDTKLLAEHGGRVHKLAIEPGSPHNFYTCGEDGLVLHIDLRTDSATKLFYCEPLLTHRFFRTLQLNAITIDPRNPNLFAVGGSDAFARVYDIRKYKLDASSDFGLPVDFFCPIHLLDSKNVGITGLTFSEQSELLVSYNDEFIYLFTKDHGLGPNPTFSSEVSRSSDPGGLTIDNLFGLTTDNALGKVKAAQQSYKGKFNVEGSVKAPPQTHEGQLNVDDDVKAAPQSYKGHKNCETVKGVNFFGPKCEYVVSGSDCGRIFIWNKKGGKLVRVMEADKHVVNCVESHPHATVLASSGIENDIKMWIPKAIDRAILPTNIHKDSSYNRVATWVPQRLRFFPFDVFYNDNEDDDDDFIYTNGDEEENDDEEEEEDSDDDEDEGSDDDDNDDGGDHCVNYDQITENHDNGMAEDLSEQLEEEEDDDSTDFVFVGDLDEDNSPGSSDLMSH